MPNKVIGYSLLIFGLIVILFSGFNVYQVFTKKADPVNLFDFPSIGIDSGQLISGSLPPELKGVIQPSSAKTEIVPSNVLNETSNVFAHLFLMGFVASLGYKIASLGVQLTRPVVVKLNQEKQVKQNVQKT